MCEIEEFILQNDLLSFFLTLIIHSWKAYFAKLVMLQINLAALNFNVAIYFVKNYSYFFIHSAKSQ
jgi:hypothetical protein